MPGPPPGTAGVPPAMKGRRGKRPQPVPARTSSLLGSRRGGIWAGGRGSWLREADIVTSSPSLTREKRTPDECHGIWAGGRGSGPREADIVTSSPSLTRGKRISRQRSGRRTSVTGSGLAEGDLAREKPTSSRRRLLWRERRGSLAREADLFIRSASLGTTWRTVEAERQVH